jgi:hypothetical protein
MDIEQIRLYTEIAGYLAGVASVLFLAMQLLKERKLEEYKTLMALEEKYTELLWRGSDQSELEQVWKPIPEGRSKLFDPLLEDCTLDSWTIWNTMSEGEKNCYRFTRSGFEILEQAYIAKRKGWVDDAEIEQKWKNWMLSWRKTNSFAPYVLAEMRHWFTPSFIKYYESLK